VDKTIAIATNLNERTHGSAEFRVGGDVLLHASLEPISEQRKEFIGVTPVPVKPTMVLSANCFILNECRNQISGVRLLPHEFEHNLCEPPFEKARGAQKERFSEIVA
jgi:hypothetical protein